MEAIMVQRLDRLRSICSHFAHVRNSGFYGAITASLTNLPASERLHLLALSLAGGAIAIRSSGLAFRGYLERKLVASDFERVPFDRFTWLSFLDPLLRTASLKPNWIPAVFVGMIFAAAMYAGSTIRRYHSARLQQRHVCSRSP